jgi:hypothetical protein
MAWTVAGNPSMVPTVTPLPKSVVTTSEAKAAKLKLDEIMVRNQKFCRDVVYKTHARIL